MKDFKSFLIGFLVCTCMLLFMGQTSSTNEENSFDDFYVRQKIKDLTDNDNEMWMQINKNTEYVNNNISEFKYKLDNLSQTMYDLSQSNMDRFIEKETYSAKVDSVNNIFEKLDFKLDQIILNLSNRIDHTDDDLESLYEDFESYKRTTQRDKIKFNKSLNLLSETYGAYEINSDRIFNYIVQSDRIPDNKTTKKNIKIDYPPDIFISYDKAPLPKIPITDLIVYPELAREAGIEGKVYLKVFIDKKGDAIAVKILHGIPNTGLNEAAIEAVEKSKWFPAKQRNKKIGVWITIPIDFSLTN